MLDPADMRFPLEANGELFHVISFALPAGVSSLSQAMNCVIFIGALPRSCAMLMQFLMKLIGSDGRLYNRPAKILFKKLPQTSF